jgi:hypothetical protein
MPELWVDTRRVGGAFSVDECARRLVHYRFAENVCMTSAAGWASSTPSIKLKFALGEHCYQDSIHSYWLGQRLPELRVTERIDVATPPTFAPPTSLSHQTRLSSNSAKRCSSKRTSSGA